MTDIKDDTTPLEYLVAGLVVLSFGLLYFLLNHSGSFWSDNDQNTPAYSSSNYLPEIAEEKQGLAAWLNTSAEPELPKASIKATVPTPEPKEQNAVVAQEMVVPEPNTQLADAIAQQQAQTAQLQSSLNDELAQLKNEVAQHKAEISQLKQAAEMQKIVRAKPMVQTEQPAIAEASFEDELQQVISNQQAITLDKIFFDTGSARLKPASLPQIEAVAKQLMDNEQVEILIRGHSDNTGSVQQNSLLSLRRSSSMKKELAKLGVNSSRMKVEGVGPLEPIASNETEEGREKNRRIELIVIE